jgi:hypothetical protein
MRVHGDGVDSMELARDAGSENPPSDLISVREMVVMDGDWASRNRLSLWPVSCTTLRRRTGGAPQWGLYGAS